jgi:hypothetical protein
MVAVSDRENPRRESSRAREWVLVMIPEWEMEDILEAGSGKEGRKLEWWKAEGVRTNQKLL